MSGENTTAVPASTQKLLSDLNAGNVQASEDGKSLVDKDGKIVAHLVVDSRGTAVFKDAEHDVAEGSWCCHWATYPNGQMVCDQWCS